VIGFQFLDNSGERVAAWLASRYERIKTEVDRGMMRSLAAVNRQLSNEYLGRASLSKKKHILRSSARRRTSSFLKRTADRKTHPRAAPRASGPSFAGRRPTFARLGLTWGRSQRRSRLNGEVFPLLRSQVVEQRITVLAELSRAIADALES
jgi:hypothetical protein